MFTIRAVVLWCRDVEPAAVGGAVTAVVALVGGIRSGHVEVGVAVAAVAAVQALAVRANVTPTPK
jgi:hypothetical protein